jgi:hypothetical protein
LRLRKSESDKSLIEVRDITKVYDMGDVQVHALRGVSAQVDEGEAHTRRIVRLLDGRVVADELVENPQDAEETLAAALAGKKEEEE